MRHGWTYLSGQDYQHQPGALLIISAWNKATAIDAIKRGASGFLCKLSTRRN
jgi:ActR/RegA family two-component response regulator